MHPLFSRANTLSNRVIGAAIEVHREIGPGLMESIYEWCLVCELQSMELPVACERTVRVRYKGFLREELLRFDVLVDGCLLIETKAVETVLPIHKAQLLSYMKLLNLPVGLLVNFNVSRLSEGISRVILKNADR